MTLAAFIAVFVFVASVDWWMDMVQRTTVLICRASNAPTLEVGELLNPAFVKFALPVTLAKWALAGFWAWYSSFIVALVALVAAFLITIFSPVPFRITLRPILKQISRVREVDPAVADGLLQVVEHWKTVNARRKGE